jgi:accessory gene regulator B
MRDYLSKKTANYLVDSISDYTYLSKLLSQRKQREYKELTKEEVQEIFAYAFKAIYGESSKVIIMLLVARLFNILLPVAIVCFVFATLRTVAGGTHMDSFIKCLVATSILIIIPTYAVNKLSLIYAFNSIELIVIVAITYLIGIIVSNKYAPRDNVNKRITDSNEITKLKNKTKMYITVISIVVLIFMLINNKMIVLCLCLGILLEMFAITPIGVTILSNESESNNIAKSN